MIANDSWPFIMFVIYLIIVFGLAIGSNQLMKGRPFLREYFLSGRSLGMWALAMTYAATSSSGGSFTGFPALIYQHGWILSLWIAGYMIVPVICLGLLGKRLNQVARKNDSITLPDIFRDRFESPMASSMIAVILALFISVYLVAQFKAGGVIVQVLLQDQPFFQRLSTSVAWLPNWFSFLSDETSLPSAGYCLGLLIFAGCVILYTAYGGFRAVVWTDVLQGFVMLFGTLCLLFFAIQSVGGLDSVPSTLVEQSKSFQHHNLLSGPGPKGDAIDGFLPIGLMISFIIFWPITGAGQPGTLIRLMAFKNTQVYRYSIFLVTVYYSLIYVPLIFIFICARAVLPELDDPDQAMPMMVTTVVPPLLSGFLLAAPFAAIMSTVDSFLLMISSSLVRDLYQRNINPNASETLLKRCSIGSTIVIGCIVMIGALNPPRFLQDIVVFASTGLACCFLAPVTLAIYWKHTTVHGVVASILGGLLSTVILYAINWTIHGGIGPYNLLGMLPAIWGLVVSFLAGIVFSLIGPPPNEALVKKYFYRHV